MKWITLYPQMNCNSYCLYCGSRAIDEVMVEKRKALGLSIPTAQKKAGPVPVKERASGLLVRLGLRKPPGPTTAVIERRNAFTVEEAVEVFKLRRSEGYTGLRFQGGEPTLWQHLPVVIGTARELGFEEVIVVSNGRRLSNPAYAETLMTSGLTGIVLSLLGPDATTHDGITLVPGSFEELMSSFRNCVQLRDSGRAKIRVSSNTIVSGETAASLPRQVELLADLGVTNITLHLVRFDFFGNDPILKKRLSFPLQEIRGPLAEAFETARRRKIHLQADDIPLCQHPTVDAEAVDRALTRSDAVTDVHWRPGQIWRAVDWAPNQSACETCLFEQTCPRAPAEYLPDGGAAALRPLHVETFLDQVRNARDIASLEDAQSAVNKLIDHGLVPPQVRLRLRETLRFSFERQLHDAVTASREPEAVRALHGLLELEPLRSYKAVGFVDRLTGPKRFVRHELTRQGVKNDNTSAPTEERRLVFAGGHAIVVAGRPLPDGPFEVSQLRATAPPDGGDVLVHDLFTEHILSMLDGVGRVRLSDGMLEGERGTSWRRLFRAREAGLLVWG